MFCQTCGKQVVEESDFCVHCGAGVRERTQEAPEAAIELPAPSGSDSQLSLKTLSVGTAFLLSLVIPGAGQFYCGKKRRALYTFLFWAGGLVVVFLASNSDVLVGIGFSVSCFLYIFGFLDAYFTAREVNSGLDIIIDDNPRIAAVLNVLTLGIGYFYVGDRKKGLILFLLGRVFGSLQGWALLVVFVLQLVLAWDAYRITQAEIERRIGTLLPGEELRPEPSRVPAVVPLIAAGCLVLALTALVVAGVMMGDGIVVTDALAT